MEHIQIEKLSVVVFKVSISIVKPAEYILSYSDMWWLKGSLNQLTLDNDRKKYQQCEIESWINSSEVVSSTPTF